MTRLIVLLIVVTAAVLSGCSTTESSETENQPSAPLKSAPATATVEAYVAVQQKLAADDFEGAQAALDGLVENSDGEIKQLGSQARQTEDIDGLRTTFIQLSERLLESGQGLGEYKIAFCPMANNGEGARWIQKDGEIRNPYYGANMLTCGRFDN